MKSRNRKVCGLMVCISPEAVGRAAKRSLEGCRNATLSLSMGLTPWKSPEEKVVARSMRTLENVGEALPFCSRAFFFDNSMLEMRFLAEYSNGSGFVSVSDNLPSWFKLMCLMDDYRVLTYG